MNFTEKKKVWSLRYTPGNNAADAAIRSVAHGQGISEVSAKIIYNRGYSSAENVETFLSPSIKNVHDAALMKDMDKAVGRIALALERGEKITVYGDYDVAPSVGIFKLAYNRRGMHRSCTLFISVIYSARKPTA